MMKLEDILQRIDRIKVYALDDDSEQEKQLLLRDIDSAIAERALPITREWMESVDGFVKRKTTLGSVYFSSEGTLIAYHPAKKQWFLNGGSVDLKIETRGQLLDLLSGLGVRM